MAAPSIGVVVTGEPALQAKVRARIAQWSQQHGYGANLHALPGEAQKTLVNCFVIEDTTCARGVFEHQASSDYLVFVRVELEGTRHGREVSLVGYWFLKDRDPVADKRGCKPCTNAALGQSIGEMMSGLFDATALAKARLRLDSPPGLVVMLDGASIGVTPIEQDVAPGSHAIALVRGSMQVGAVTVETKAGEISTVDVPIEAAAPAPASTTAAEAPVAEHGPARFAPGALMAAGVGALAVGGVFVYYGHKNGPNDPLIYPDATTQGAIIAGVGGAAIVGGLVWWWLGASSSSRPTVAISGGGGTVGWAGTFR